MVKPQSKGEGGSELYNHQINKFHIINRYYNQLDELLLMLISCHMNQCPKNNNKTKNRWEDWSGFVG